MTTSKPKVPKWLAALGVIGAAAVSFFVIALLHSPSTPSLGQWSVVLHVGAVFASLGCIFGSVAALDGQTELAVGDRPVLRTLLCAFFGAVTVLIVWSSFPEKFHPAWSSMGAIIGAGLGWSGWRWARYIDEGL